MSHEPDELRRRAALLAAPSTGKQPTDEMALFALSWAGVRYLVPAVHVSRSSPVADLTVLPATSRPVLGLVTVRGDAVPVVDPQTLLGRPRSAHAPAAVVVLDDGRRPSLGLPADELQSMVRMPAAGLQAPADLPVGVHALTPEGCPVLDTDWLLDLPPFFTTEGSAR